MRACLFLFICVFINICAAQVADDFADGNFSQNPHWLGDTSKFSVNTSKQLKLNTSGAGTAYLSTPASFVIKNNEWRFYIKLSFSPSDNNNARFYLSSTAANLTQNLNGYFIRLGENGSFDSVDLWEQNGTTETKIIDGKNGHCAKTTNTLHIKVTRDSTGKWELFSDTLGGTNYLLEGSVTNNAHTTINAIGLVCNFTSSNATNFYFDDIYAGAQQQDLTPPQLDSLQVISSTQLDLFFNEPLDNVSSENTSNYVVNNGIGNPTTATIDSILKNKIHLKFLTPFTSGLTNTLTIFSASDLYNNSSGPILKTFSYFTPLVTVEKDVIFNEIYTDPSPSLGLPAAEYIELYNRTANDLPLKNWTITDGVTTGKFTSGIIKSNSHLIACNMADTGLFSTFGNTVGLSYFPTLNNSGDRLILKNENGIRIDSVTYDLSWYRDSLKQQGGYSLELINSNSKNLCKDKYNWEASIAPLGGTPGAQNSVYLQVDSLAPTIISCNLTDSLHLQLCLNKPVFNFDSLKSYSITPSDISLINVKEITPGCYSFTLNATPKQNLNYALHIHSLNDCSGNSLVDSAIFISAALPERALLINEIMFDPKPTSVEFIEIYNNSNAIINLKNVSVCTYDTVLSKTRSCFAIAKTDQYLNANAYLVLSTNDTLIKSQYTCIDPNAFLNLKSVPYLYNSGGAIAITNERGLVVDEFTYSPSMHFSLLDNTKGVSLERINVNIATNQRSNWHSASATCGYATPGYKNSQATEASGKNNITTVSPEIFSPDNDGYNDVLLISCTPPSNGYKASITIYDAEGRKIRELVKNTLLGTTNTFMWDGLSDKLEKASIGIYIIYAELFNPSGEVIYQKNTCVLGGKF